MSSTCDKNFKALKKFAKENGHCNVPYKGDTRYLAKWVNRRKLKYKDDPTKIPPSEINELNRIGFDWSTRKDKDDKHWNEIYQRLLEFKRKHGHCMVPLTYARDIELGNWVSNQRKRAKQNKLRQDRRELLNKIKFTWIVLNPTKKQNQTKSYVKHDEKWNQMFGKLKKFKSEHGHCKVPYNYHHDHALGMWVSTQRRVFQKKTFMYGDRKEMHQIRKDLLDSIDFDFSPQTGNDNFSSKDSPDHPRASVYESLKEEGHGHQSSDDGSDDICDSAEESEIIAV